LKTLRAVLFVVFAAAQALRAYGPSGHEIVGRIADELLTKKPAGAQISALIDGISLERASVMPDEIKAWDKNGPDDLNQFPHYRDHPKIDQELREFWHANPPTPDPNSSVPSHHWFHYTDVPVFSVEKYADGKVGRSKWDIVHMIPYCVSVLRGETPENNERKITKAVAVLLLAHYVGDIHQPLHVGAEYFDEGGHAIDPDKTKSALADEGGNTFSIHLSDDPAPHRGIHYKKLHGFWDLDAVNTLLPQIKPTLPKEEKQRQTNATVKQIAHEMATAEPKDWRLPPNVDLKKYAEAWVDEILPIAREAHERLQLNNVHSQVDQGKTVAMGDAQEKPAPDHVAYRQWASNVVRDELHKAGWRLADLLEKSVTRSTSSEPAAAVPPEPMPAAAATSSPTVAASAAYPSLRPCQQRPRSRRTARVSGQLQRDRHGLDKEKPTRRNDDRLADGTETSRFTEHERPASLRLSRYLQHRRSWQTENAQRVDT
jgi:hypothetical protein